MEIELFNPFISSAAQPWHTLETRELLNNCSSEVFALKDFPMLYSHQLCNQVVHNVVGVKGIAKRMMVDSEDSHLDKTSPVQSFCVL